jgi:hypothetical protein
LHRSQLVVLRAKGSGEAVLNRMEPRRLRNFP